MKSPFVPFRVLASAARTTTTYGTVLRVPQGARGIMVAAKITALASANIAVKVKTGLDAANITQDATSPTFGTAASGNWNAVATFTCVVGPGAATSQNMPVCGFCQLAVVPPDASSNTYDLWACFTE